MLAFITGGSNGIGAAIVKRFLSASFDVHSTYCKSDIKKLPKNCKWHQYDLTRTEDIDGCCQLLRDLKPQILINNAGININSSFEEIDLKVFNEIQQINTIAPLKFMQAVLDGMKDKNFGRIVNIASIWSIISKEERASYSASKFALDGLTLAFSTEYCKSNILANCISPGFIDTELTQKTLGKHGIQRLIETVPMRRLGKADEVAELVFWLASDKNSFVTGQNIAIDGGFSRT